MESAFNPVRNSSTSGVTALASGQSVGGGRYLLKKILGHGGMGVVWLAHDRLLGEAVALKFVPPQIGFDPAALEGLRRETLQARRLSHPNILRIHDLVDTPDESTFISMEYVDGVDLHTLRANRPGRVLTWRFLDPLIRQVCEALAYLHAQRVVHRDLKPANLLLDSSSRVKLADFGLARVVTDSLSRLSSEGHTSGTLAYMSPQQADGRKPQATDDIYALGATLFELLTSSPPFHSGDVAYQVRHHQPPRMQVRLAELELENTIPPTAEALVMACLAKDPQQRPQSAAGIIQWIDALESDSASSSTSVSTAREDAEPMVDDDAKPGWSRWPLVAALVLLAVAAGFMVVKTTGKKPSPGADGKSASSVPIAPETPNDFQILFNGRDLTGWEGDPDYWRVEDGAITAFAPEEGVKRRENTCLIWGESVGDFELRLSYRQKDVITEKPANSGIMYRARRVGDWQMRGYQVDLHGAFTGTLLLLQEDLRDPRVDAGKAAVLRSLKNETTVDYLGATATAKDLAGAFRKGDWNDVVIIAKGNRLLHRINNVVMADVTDERVAGRALSGLLALEMKRATVVQFREIRLKRFD